MLMAVNSSSPTATHRRRATPDRDTPSDSAASCVVSRVLCGATVTASPRCIARATRTRTSATSGLNSTFSPSTIRRRHALPMGRAGILGPTRAEGCPNLPQRNREAESTAKKHGIPTILLVHPDRIRTFVADLDTPAPGRDAPRRPRAAPPGRTATHTDPAKAYSTNGLSWAATKARAGAGGRGRSLRSGHPARPRLWPAIPSEPGSPNPPAMPRARPGRSFRTEANTTRAPAPDRPAARSPPPGPPCSSRQDRPAARRRRTQAIEAR